jgi:pimeloyl-ACP methyl ester carboxylesterase
MSDVNLNLNYHVPEFSSLLGATTLAVVLHAYGVTSEKMADVKHAVQKAFGQENVDIYSPTLPYSDPLDPTGADEIVLRLVADLDEIWSKKLGGYDKVVFIGHSLGGNMLRRVFLVGSLNPPDYDQEFKRRDELYEKVLDQRKKQPKLKGLPDEEILPCDWAPKVERLILLASWNKGWSVSPRTSWFYSIGLNALGVVGRLSEFSGALASWQPGRTMLDMRQGAPFVVQTRLLWMAYRRWHNSDLREKYNEHKLGATLDDPADRKKDGKPLTINPLVVQIVGSLDDFVSPQDQVDLDVEGVRAWLPCGDAGVKTPSGKNYFMLEMESCDHGAVVKLSGDETRKNLFTAALTSTREQFEKPADDSVLKGALRNPVNFLDTPPEIDENVEHVVFVMHGIRDDGYWTHRVAAAIKEEWAKKNAENEAEKRKAKEIGEGSALANAAPTSASSEAESQTEGAQKPENASEKIKFYPSWTQTYGYFPMLPFVLPWIRRSKVEWFMDNYVSVKAAYPAARLHYVGHSNGTYIGARALKDYPGARFGKMYFAGCVVHPQYNWVDEREKKQVESFHNARGGEDWVVALLPKSLEYFTDLGGAGFDGFDETATDKKGEHAWPLNDNNFTQSKLFATGGHGGAIGEKHWGEIAKFLVRRDYRPFGLNEPIGELFATEQDRFYKFLGGLRIGVPLGFALAGLFLLLAGSFFLPDHWNWEVILTAVFWVWWLAAAGVYLNKSTSTPPPPPKPTLAFYAMAGGVVILSVVSPIVLVGNPWGWIWAALLAVFMALQYFSKWGGGNSNQQVYQIQRAPTGLAQILLTLLFCALAISFVGWLIWSIYAALAEYAHFGKCKIDVTTPLIYTQPFALGELAIFVFLLYPRLAPSWLDKDFPNRFKYFKYTAFGIFLAWIALMIFFYESNAHLCSDQFRTVRSGLAVGALFLLATLIRFILLRV